MFLHVILAQGHANLCITSILVHAAGASTKMYSLHVRIKTQDIFSILTQRSRVFSAWIVKGQKYLKDAQGSSDPSSPLMKKLNSSVLFYWLILLNSASKLFLLAQNGRSYFFLIFQITTTLTSLRKVNLHAFVKLMPHLYLNYLSF